MDVDAIVIGSGQAGVPLAARLATSGRQTVLVERSRLGGTCINYGCTPTKTMVASARAAHVARTAGRLGVHSEPVRIDLPAIVARKDAMVRQWREGVEGRLAAAGERLRVLNGHGRFTGEREIEVAGARYRGEIVVINTLDFSKDAIKILDGIIRGYKDHFEGRKMTQEHRTILRRLTRKLAELKRAALGISAPRNHRLQQAA